MLSKFIHKSNLQSSTAVINIGRLDITKLKVQNLKNSEYSLCVRKIDASTFTSKIAYKKTMTESSNASIESDRKAKKLDFGAQKGECSSEEFRPRADNSAVARCSHVAALVRSSGGGGGCGGADDKCRGCRSRCRDWCNSDDVCGRAHPDAELLLQVVRELRLVLV